MDILKDKEKLKYYNEYGGFSENGREYLIKINKNNRLPSVWSHIMANEKFGTLVTESMGGYTWYKNSRLNRISVWENDSTYDIPSEIIYIKDMENKKTWSLGSNPKPDKNNYNVIYGFGYCKYIHRNNGIIQELETFVPLEDSCKIGILKLKNETASKRNLKLYYYIKPVIGEDEIKTNDYIDLQFEKNSNILYGRNLYREEMENTKIYVSSSEKIKSYTGDRNFFLGNKKLDNPEGIKKISLNNENSFGKSPCICFEIEIDLERFEEKEIIFILGAEEELIDCKNIAYKYQKIQNCKEELYKAKKYWKDLLDNIQVYTPLESVNIMLNGWIPYQIITSRLFRENWI